jgi:hypothetical protein
MCSHRVSVKCFLIFPLFNDSKVVCWIGLLKRLIGNVAVIPGGIDLHDFQQLKAIGLMFGHDVNVGDNENGADLTFSLRQRPDVDTLVDTLARSVWN